MRTLPSVIPLACGALIAFNASLSAAPILIDNFETGGVGLEVETPGQSESTSEDGINVMGKERITTVTLVDGDRAFAQINSGSSGLAVLGVDGDSRAAWQFEYGVSDPWWDDLVGTGGNFNLGASFLAADPGGTLTIEVRDRLLGNEGTASTPIGPGPGMTLIGFDEFPGVDFSDITYVRFQIDGAAGGGYTLDAFMSTNSIPTPSAVQGGLVLLVLVMLVTRRRGRRHRQLDLKVRN